MKINTAKIVVCNFLKNMDEQRSESIFSFKSTVKWLWFYCFLLFLNKTKTSKLHLFQIKTSGLLTAPVDWQLEVD